MIHKLTSSNEIFKKFRIFENAGDSEYVCVIKIREQSPLMNFVSLFFKLIVKVLFNSLKDTSPPSLFHSIEIPLSINFVLVTD